jgi:5-methyltetrahydrofolate--homocysteine methyltransferase
MVGGAALSRMFADTRIAPEYGAPVLYAKDAMDGLELANRLMDPLQREQLLQSLAERQSVSKEARKTGPAATLTVKENEIKPAIRHDAPIPASPDFAPHILRDIPVNQVLPYLNRQMLYSKHLGLIGALEKMLEAGDEKAVKLHQSVEALLAEVQSEQLINIQAMYRFYPAASDGNDLVLYDPELSGSEAMRFTFPRQVGQEKLCISDFVRPVGSGEPDNIALFVVTCGQGIREQAERLKEQGEYLKCHMLQALALELAEATAEFMHKRIRTGWGIVDDPNLTMKDVFNAGYQGIRVSFGYPACPEISYQEKLFKLLQPEQIGVHLTEGFMMDPEASISAIVFHHPQGKYFDASR